MEQKPAEVIPLHPGRTSTELTVPPESPEAQAYRSTVRALKAELVRLRRRR
jgi:hypothetical protein